jgi:hypothetical protein
MSRRLGATRLAIIHRSQDLRLARAGTQQVEQRTAMRSNGAQYLRLVMPFCDAAVSLDDLFRIYAKKSSVVELASPRTLEAFATK